MMRILLVMRRRIGSERRVQCPGATRYTTRREDESGYHAACRTRGWGTFGRLRILIVSLDFEHSIFHLVLYFTINEFAQVAGYPIRNETARQPIGMVQKMLTPRQPMGSEIIRLTRHGP